MFGCGLAVWLLRHKKFAEFPVQPSKIILAINAVDAAGAVQLPLRPKEITPAITLESPIKFGPPESPKHVPPVESLLDNISEKSFTIPPLIWIR